MSDRDDTATQDRPWPGQRAGWCIHYRAPPRDFAAPHICAAGVNYREAFTVPGPRPCFLDDAGHSKPGSLHCDHLRRPKPEEIAEYEAWLNARMALYSTVGAAVSVWRKKHRGQSFEEVIPCPACNGRLHLSIARYNGHVRGHCETKGCVSWME